MNPFKVGDVVYTTHINDGSLKIGSIHESGCYVGKASDFKGAKSRWCLYEDLSFSPWPAPNHTRPFETVLKRGDLVVIKPMDGGMPFFITILQEFKDSITSGMGSSWPKSEYTFHRIGEEIKFN